jgi:hypothetical protein
VVLVLVRVSDERGELVVQVVRDGGGRFVFGES